MIDIPIMTRIVMTYYFICFVSDIVRVKYQLYLYTCKNVSAQHSYQQDKATIGTHCDNNSLGVWFSSRWRQGMASKFM